MKKILMAAVMAALSASISLGAVVIYDGFTDAPSTNMPTGWLSDDPNPANNYSVVADGSLAYTGSASSGNSMGLAEKTADYYTTFSGQDLAGGESLYFSFRMRINEANVFNSGTIRLCDGDDPYGNAVTIGVGTTDYTTDLMGFSLHNRHRNWAHVDSINTPETYALTNVTRLIVGCYTRGESGNGSGTVSMWVDPAITNVAPTPTLTMASYTEDEVYDRVQIVSAGSGSWVPDWQFDELKVGSEWADVVSASTPGDTAPVASFSASPTNGVIPVTVTFNDLSSGTITNRIWDFGDGTITNTTLTSLQHTYASTGTYSVELIVSGPLGASTNTQTDLITAIAPILPVASFSADPVSGYEPLLVDFTDASTGTITNRYWDFGDGSTTNITGTSISHTYLTDGTYTVSLTASGPAGSDTDTQVDVITVENVPDGTFFILSDTADQSIGVDSNGTQKLAWVGQTQLYTGDDNYTTANSKGDMCGIMVFELPDLAGSVIDSADLEVHWEADYVSGGDDPLPKAVDLYGVRYSTNSTVYTNDYGYKAIGTSNGTLIQTALVVQDTSEVMDYEITNTTAAGDAALADWLTAQYTAGAQAGDYVFLRLHATSHSANPFDFGSGDDAPNAPVLTIVTASGGPTEPPAEFSVTAVAALGSGSDVLNWTTEAGYTYSVWYSTNLLDGFQPLETNLDESVTSLTNLITTSPVFYKIEANW